MRAEPAYPAWLLEHVRRQREFIDGLSPFPFDPPADSTPFLCLHQNNYLRLARHPEVVRARHEANLRACGDPSAPSMLGGSSCEHDAFRASLRDALQADDVILTTSGWTANVGLVEAIARPELPVYLDVGGHPSLADGARLARTRRVMFRHNDPGHLERRLRAHGPGVVCVDALYSTDGALCDLESFADVCARHDCTLVVDEAHSFGMFAAAGGGLTVERGLLQRVHFRTLSLSKALGGHGGAVAAGGEMIRALSARMRPVLFSSPTSAVLSAGHRAALQVMVREPERARRCLAMAALLRAGLRRRGVRTAPGAGPIIAIRLRGEAACELYARLRRQGILTSVFVYPAVPKGTSVVRFSVHADVGEADVRRAAECAATALREMGLLP